MTGEKTNGQNELPENERPKTEEESNLAAEFAALGKKFAEAVETAWQSEERLQLQQDLKEGLDRFTAEVDGAIRSVRSSDVGQKVGSSVQQAASEVKSGKVSGEVRKGMVTALRALSTTLERLAEGFTPAEEEAPKE